MKADELLGGEIVDLTGLKGTASSPMCVVSNGGETVLYYSVSFNVKVPVEHDFGEALGVEERIRAIYAKAYEDPAPRQGWFSRFMARL